MWFKPPLRRRAFGSQHNAFLSKSLIWSPQHLLLCTIVGCSPIHPQFPADTLLKAATIMQSRHLRVGPGLSCMFHPYENSDQGLTGGHMKFWPLDDHLVPKDISTVSWNAHVLSCPGLSNEIFEAWSSVPASHSTRFRSAKRLNLLSFQALRMTIIPWGSFNARIYSLSKAATATSGPEENP